MDIHTVLAPNAPWPSPKPKKLGQVNKHKISPYAARIAAYIEAHPGCRVAEIAAALGVRHHLVNDHVIYGCVQGKYRRVNHGVFIC